MDVLNGDEQFFMGDHDDFPNIPAAPRDFDVWL